METIRRRAYPRGGLIGNPSDGYFGRTIALSFTNFHAEVVLQEAAELEILPSSRDVSVYSGIRALQDDVSRFGYYGGVRLLKAAIRRFADYSREHGLALHDRNFTVRCTSDIPPLVGLAGSSAIITACMRCLMDFYGVRIPPARLASLVLSVETDELGIAGGLQDRVAQAYQGVVYMDFDRALMAARGFGRYEPLDPALLPPLYIAYRKDLAEGSEVVHNRLRERYNAGDPEVLAAIAFWRDLASQVRDLLVAGRGREIGPLLNANFDRRAAVMAISEGNRRMVGAARSVGASAKFTGSGGAIIGTYDDGAMFDALCCALKPMGVEVIVPTLAPSLAETECE